MSLVKILLVVILVVAYVALSHVALINPDPNNIWRKIAALMLIVPILAMINLGIISMLRQAKATAIVLVGSGAFMLALSVYGGVLLWPKLLNRLDWFYLVQHIATNLMLFFFFAQTLLRDRTPVITALATTLHGSLPDSIVRYTRGVTLAWALFFAGQILLSLIIFYWFSVETWSLFANVLNWPLVILMFVVEYICRKKMNPDFQHASIKQSIGAYFASKNKA